MYTDYVGIGLQKNCENKCNKRCHVDVRPTKRRYTEVATHDEQYLHAGTGTYTTVDEILFFNSKASVIWSTVKQQQQQQQQQQ